MVWLSGLRATLPDTKLVTHVTNRTDAVMAAIGAAPGSLRTLARASGVDHALLSRISTGERQATEAVALKVADALEQWAEVCSNYAAAIRETE